MSYVNENEQLESKLKDLRRMLKDIQGQINEKLFYLLNMKDH